MFNSYFNVEASMFPDSDNTYDYIPESSTVMNKLKQKHSLGITRKDGNCFYHSVAQLLNSNPYTLRENNFQQLTEGEVSLLYSLRSEEDATCENGTWVDHIEMNACLRLFPDHILILVDDDAYTVSLHGNLEAKNAFAVQLKQYHFRPIFCNAMKLRSIITKEFVNVNEIIYTHRNSKCSIM